MFETSLDVYIPESEQLTLFEPDLSFLEGFNQLSDSGETSAFESQASNEPEQSSASAPPPAEAEKGSDEPAVTPTPAVTPSSPTTSAMPVAAQSTSASADAVVASNAKDGPEATPSAIEKEHAVTAEAAAQPKVKYPTQSAKDILAEAIEKRCSDLQIEPEKDHTVVRFVDKGSLLQESKLPASTHESLVASYKFIASLDIQETKRPQDKRCKIRSKQTDVVVRITTIPGEFGETVALTLRYP
jgi:type II secretory ATPase GspE/PulE/Tfp pilus assembly ATPase PilB-like protein